MLYLWLLGRWYFLVTVIDAYSRYIVAWDLCWKLMGDAMALVLREALDRAPGATPEVVSDNGSEFVNRDFPTALKAKSLQQIRTWAHHPQSNGTVERYHRTFREEGWRSAQPANYPTAKAVIARWVTHYNTVRLHNALGYLATLTYYRGDPDASFTECRRRLQMARSRRQDAWETY